MNLKVVVKVMNFHSLLRVESSRRKAEKYFELEREISRMIGYVANNRNFILDKKALRPNPGAPELNIYFGSDYGFCGSINSHINAILVQEAAADKISVGRKLRMGQPRTLLRISREEFDGDYSPVSEIIRESIENLRHSKINLVYNHYYNTTHIETIRRCVFPMEMPENEQARNYDFVVEGDVNRLLQNLVGEYIDYEIKIASVNCYASENIMRQNATVESLKKIEEREAEELKSASKERSRIQFQKVIDGYIKKKGLERV